MQGETRKVSPNPRIRQSNRGRSSRKEGVSRRLCYYCDDNGFVPQRQYRRSYLRWYRWRAKRERTKRIIEPHCHMVPCPVCQKG